jgi:hypothetical protein
MRRRALASPSKINYAAGQLVRTGRYQVLAGDRGHHKLAALLEHLDAPVPAALTES